MDLLIDDQLDAFLKGRRLSPADVIRLTRTQKAQLRNDAAIYLTGCGFSQQQIAAVVGLRSHAQVSEYLKAAGSTRKVG